MNDNTDHEARRVAGLALARIEQHEKHCEERARKAEIFEGEMRSSMRDLTASIKDGNGRIHTRLDTALRGGIGLTMTIIIGMVGAVLWWLVQRGG